MKDKARILVVEDERIIGIDLKKTLTKLNYDVIDVVSNGASAIKVAIQVKPDLILMDIVLDGEMNGIEAAQIIQQSLEVPIIYLTAYTDEYFLNRAKITNPFGYLIKPYEEHTLQLSIEMALYRHSVDLKLKISEERYRTLIEYSPIAIGIHAEGKVVYVNTAAIKLFGAKSEIDLIGKPIMELVMPSFRDLVQERVKRATQRKEKLDPIEEKFMTLDGRELDVEVSAIPIDFQGKEAVQVVIRDISEIKKKERIHQTTIKILQSVNLSNSFEQQCDYLHKTLVDYIESKNVCFALYDKGSESISFPAFSYEFDDTPLPRKFGNGLIEYTIRSGRTQLLKKVEIVNLIESEKIYFEGHIPTAWMGMPLSLDDNVTIVIILKEYVSEYYLSSKELELLNAISLPLTRAFERKMLEDEKRETLFKLKELNQTKDNFFSIISHDLRSPFDSILGFTEILKNEYEKLTAEEIKLYLDSLYDSSRHIYNLLNNLLQYSRFALGKMEFNPKSLELNKVINTNIEMLRGTALKKEITLVNFQNDEILIFADEDMVNSILLNLLTNAIKFSKRGGEVRVTVRVNGDFGVISIQDYGIGISEENIEKLFKLDTKKSEPGTENESGTGLGLLIVKQFVEKNGGTISVQSQISSGSIFTFTLPLFTGQKADNFPNL